MKPKSPRIRQTLSNGPANGPRNLTSPRTAYTKTLIPGTVQKRRSFTQIGPKKTTTNGSFDKKKNIGQKRLLEKAPAPPAGLLTPSSSDTSVTTIAVPRSEGQRNCKIVPKIVTLPKEPLSLTTTPYLKLKRQQTAAMINYQARKSVSQMDFKEARRSGNYQLVAHVPCKDEQTVGAVAGLDANMSKMLMQDASQMYDASIKGRMSFIVSPDQDARLASLKIFNTIMLHAWRKRRAEVRHITEQLEDQKKMLLKTRNQLHVYTSLFSEEQCLNVTLNEQLRLSYREAVVIKLSYEELNLKLKKINDEKQRLADEIKLRDLEIKNLHEMQQSLNSELFRANADQGEHLKQIAQLQRDYQESLGIQQEQYIKLELFENALEASMKIIKEIRNEMEITEKIKLSSEEKYNKLLDHTKQVERTAQQMEEQVALLQSCLAATMGQRIRQCLIQREAYKHATYRMLHFVADYVLPGNGIPPPPPSISQAIRMIKDLIFAKLYGEGNDTDSQDGMSLKMLIESKEIQQESFN
ncbi:GL19365 [Drosophila persimilis]|uniref:GL19365 n=1 Tax=Drosophila persimilis TaxID=7234 RepID=B4G8W7_DROPE|nr:uncharacterized protein LOC6589350 [Drosophila persimilis]EDW28797.1 GL19365 [Drosophila persimilis]